MPSPAEEKKKIKEQKIRIKESIKTKLSDVKDLKKKLKQVGKK